MYLNSNSNETNQCFWIRLECGSKIWIKISVFFPKVYKCVHVWVMVLITLVDLESNIRLFCILKWKPQLIHLDLPWPSSSWHHGLHPFYCFWKWRTCNNPNLLPSSTSVTGKAAPVLWCSGASKIRRRCCWFCCPSDFQLSLLFFPGLVFFSFPSPQLLQFHPSLFFSLPALLSLCSTGRTREREWKVWLDPSPT